MISSTALRRHVTGSSLISCSLDGTVRVWSLETLIEVWILSWQVSHVFSISSLSLQCNRLDLGMELLGLSVNNCGGGGGGETAQLLVHSHQDISMWQLSQVSQLSQHLHPISTDPLTSVSLSSWRVILPACSPTLLLLVELSHQMRPGSWPLLR